MEEIKGLNYVPVEVLISMAEKGFRFDIEDGQITNVYAPDEES